MFKIFLQKIDEKFPDFKGSNRLIGMLFNYSFIQQDFDKLPFDQSTAQACRLPTLLTVSSNLI